MQACALTGGIGSGKSTLADALEAQGIPVLRADRLAAEAIAPNTPGFSALVEHFGPKVLDNAGALDRKALGDLVFADPQQKKALEDIVHPLVHASYQEKTQALRAKGEALVLYEIPLLIETGQEHSFDCVIVITAPMPARLTRVATRSGLSPEQVSARIANQVSDHRRILAADLVVHNDAGLEALQAQVPALLTQLRERLAFKARFTGV